ncbi:hypothetical protein Taro_030075 [Colocasia esculenta]|uniref:Uncharacterized protein n=1 Tax=Colocasia esculenta TaxID=4460 RepID=A0A843VN13_COLES|nr:hypothetical protein [Colocasia esculenta]
MFLRTYGLISLARLRPVRGRWTRVRLVVRLTGLNSEDRHSDDLVIIKCDHGGQGCASRDPFLL